jgi:hypothetical protein
VNAMLSRLGRSLRRAPYVWGALTFVVWLYMLSALSPLVEDDRNAKTWIAVVAACLIAYSLIVALVLWPRLVIGRAKLPTSDDQIAVIRWTFATTPFLVGLGSVAVGVNNGPRPSDLLRALFRSCSRPVKSVATLGPPETRSMNSALLFRG